MFILLLALILSSEALQDKEEWVNFKTKHRKVFLNPLNEIQRFSIFQSNLRTIEAHNAKEEQGLSSFRMGVTKFADLTPQEFKEMMKLSLLPKPHNNEMLSNLEDKEELPDEIDWNQKGAVTKVEDQGICSSPSEFSITGTVEGANFIKNGKLISLSEQNIVDCVPDCKRSNGGCVVSALNYIKKNGIMSEEDYPCGGVSQACQFNATKIAAKISGYTQIRSGDEEDLQQKVALVGPVSVAIEASSNFQFYVSGILNDPMCGNQVNHEVLLVGYGSQNGTDYWIVKNSWGLNWGMKGYIWMSRNKNNQCGIATYAVVAFM